MGHALSSCVCLCVKVNRQFFFATALKMRLLELLARRIPLRNPHVCFLSISSLACLSFCLSVLIIRFPMRLWNYAIGLAKRYYEWTVRDAAAAHSVRLLFDLSIFYASCALCPLFSTLNAILHEYLPFSLARSMALAAEEVTTAPLRFHSL